MDLLLLAQFLMWLYVLFTWIQSIPGATPVGQTVEQVREALGDPDKILSLETETVYVYRDMKIVFEGGRISKIAY